LNLESRSPYKQKADNEMMQKAKSKVTRIHHIGVTVNDAQKAVAEWKEAFGFAGKVVDIPENNIHYRQDAWVKLKLPAGLTVKILIN
jgi:catechol-2,3-dioxygenase